ncbi:MAG: hypothetical protein JXR27_11675 [Paludibacteraceae bacterium]|nr:hypothetical protein [Paludibacteraceae bacterium]
MEEKKQNEINLLDLMSMFVAWLRTVGHKLLIWSGNIVRLMYRKKWYVMAVLFIAFAFGQYLARPSERVYKAEGTALILGPDAQTVRQIFRQLENADARNEHTSLATKLNLPDSVASNVQEIKAFYMIDFLRDSVADKVDFSDSHSLTDTMNVRMRDRVYIRMKTKNIAQVPQVEAAIVHFLNSNVVVKAQYKAKINDLQNQISICNRELNRIDSLAGLYYFRDNDNAQMSFERNTLVMGEQRKQLFYGDLMRIQQLRNDAEMRLSKFTQPVEIPSALVVSPVPINSRFKFAVYSLLFGLIAGLVLAGFLESISIIMQFLKEKS